MKNWVVRRFSKKPTFENLIENFLGLITKAKNRKSNLVFAPVLPP